jgi:MraZ protein
MGQSLIGSYTGKLDKSGRLKIPEKFRAAIEEKFGKELFVTSLGDEAVQIYPLSVWESLAGGTQEGATLLRPSVRKFMIRVNRNGQSVEIDAKGRVLISPLLREKAKLQGEVEVLGLTNHLEVWNSALLDERLAAKPLSDEDFEHIAELMPRGKLG